MEIETNNCPRCMGSLEPRLFKDESPILFGCRECRLVVGSGRPAVIISNLLGDDAHLGWFVKEKCCYYGSLSQVLGRFGTKLPWLPFDLSVDKLKIYLTFS